MWIRLRTSDFGTIVHYTGVFVVGMGIAMVVPLLTAVATSISISVKARRARLLDGLCMDKPKLGAVSQRVR